MSDIDPGQVQIAPEVILARYGAKCIECDVLRDRVRMLIDRVRELEAADSDSAAS